MTGKERPNEADIRLGFYNRVECNIYCNTVCRRDEFFDAIFTG